VQTNKLRIPVGLQSDSKIIVWWYHFCCKDNW